MASDAKDIYITGLRNAHALEAQAIQLLSRQVERLENYPEMLQRMRAHIEESRRQQERIDQILDSLGTSASTLKDIGTSIMGNVMAAQHAIMQDEVVKNTFANYAFEHFEIAAYRGLISFGQACGDASGVRLLEQSLEEERAMARWIDEHLESTVQRYMQLEVSGQKSGV